MRDVARTRLEKCSSICQRVLKLGGCIIDSGWGMKNEEKREAMSDWVVSV